jgi:hypothetical protein
VSATNATGNAKPPDVAYDPVNNRFLVAWTGNPKIGSMAANENEVFAGLVGADGALLTPADLRISHVGPDGNGNFLPVRPAIAFNRFTHQYLLDWSGDNDTEGGVDEESEVWGQRTDASGIDIGPTDFRISHNGPDGDVNFAAARPALAFNPVTCQDMTVWHTGSLANSFGSDNEKINVFGNLLPESSCPRPIIKKKGKSKLKQRKGGRILVLPGIRVKCPDTEDCTAKERVKFKKGKPFKKRGKKLTVRPATSTIKLGTTGKLSFVLTPKGAKVLRRRGELKVTIKVTARVGKGPKVTATKKLLISSPAH